jgi:phenylalanyl-tRNA synthetase beta chain
MRVPLTWLREFVDLPADAPTIADRLAMLGFPVEAIETRPRISGVVVARIVELRKHPNADRLQVAQLDAGGDRKLTVATAATNVAPEQVVALATIGARLPQLTIEPRKMRGIASEGMMISAEELALPAEWFEDGIMQFEADRVPGSDVVALFGLDEAVHDVEITSNRVDAMSIVGLARELAASYGKPLRLPPFQNPGSGEEARGLRPQVAIESPDCLRFVAQRFENIAVAPAPAWMRVRLALAGQRPINNVVDVSNYVAIETGQPLHFYDAARSGATFVVRDAREGEKLTTLDGIERTLTPQALVVAGEREAYGLAGLMGGASTEVSDSTTAIVLEAATFNGPRIRRTAKALGLRTEAAVRHEKSLAPALADAGAARAAVLLSSLGATAYPPHEFGATLRPAEPIRLRSRDVERLLGLTLKPQRIAAHLTALGCAVEFVDGDVLAVTSPAWRRDLIEPADLVEEVARMEGYDRIEAAIPSVAPHAISSSAFERENAIARELAALRYREIVTHSLHGREPLERAARAGFTWPDPAEVLNPLSEDQRYLRASLADGFIAYLARTGTPVRVFEIGHVFGRHDASIAEKAMLTFGFSAEAADEPAWRDSNFLRLKGDCEALLRALTGRRPETTRDGAPGLHPGKTATMRIDDRDVATLGRLDPRLANALDLRLAAYLCSVELESLPHDILPVYRPPSKFPETYRDIALMVDLEVAAAEIERAIADCLDEVCTGVRVFDEYRGPQVPPGRKCLAARLFLGHSTITDEEADAAMAHVLEVLHVRWNATVRA